MDLITYGGKKKKSGSTSFSHGMRTAEICRTNRSTVPSRAAHKSITLE